MAVCELGKRLAVLAWKDTGPSQAMHEMKRVLRDGAEMLQDL